MFSCRRFALVLAFTLGVGSSHDASAQGGYRWSADGAVGAASVNGGGFFDNGPAAAHLAVANRVLQRGALATYVEAGYDWQFRLGPLGGNPDLICIVNTPGGSCAPSFPDVTGASLSIGLAYAPFSKIETRVSLGGAAYSVGGTVVDAAVGQLDAAVFPARHVGLMLAARYAVIPRYRHDRLTMLPVLLGLRVR